MLLLIIDEGNDDGDDDGDDEWDDDRDNDDVNNINDKDDIGEEDATSLRPVVG